MASNCRVVDFYGLPGCGKTTLKNKLLEMEHISVDIAQNQMLHYKKESVLFKLIHLPFKQWWRLTLFLISLSGIRKNPKQYYIDLYSKVLAYSYFVEKSCCDLIVVDHGLVQQLGSILHNQNYELSERSLIYFMNFLDGMKGTIPVYCRLSSEISLMRMRQRKRNVGRIDAIMNDKDCALSLLEKEYSLFERISKASNESNVELNMMLAPEELASDILNKLGIF